ncbi:MAG TPA: FAD-dependent oxidoreductase [Candidatus Binatia bacterium]|nr:FAD-dependent oxidoreductase [Candidatus Binatia bacterium]
MTSDVVVVGAGTMGAWTALWARRSGRAVTLVDAYGAGHPRATSGGETRIIRASHGTDVLYTRWSRRARTLWQEANEEWGEPLFQQAGCLWFASRADGFEADSEATLRAEGIPAERLTPAEVAARWPHIAADDVAFALFEPEAGLLLARRAVMAIARALTAEGGRFELATARPGARDGRTLGSVTTADGGTIAGGTFVFACGPWLPRLFPDVLGDLIRVTKQDVLFFGSPAGDSSYDASRTPCIVDYDAAMYGVPAVDGRGFKAAPDRYGPVFDPSRGDRLVDPESVRLARAFIERRFPGLAGQPIVETRVCQYETTPDTNFVIDRHPDFDNVWLVGGGSGHGFKHGPVIGRYVVDRLDGAPLGEGEERFGLDRPRISQAGVRTGGDSIAKHWQGY